MHVIAKTPAAMFRAGALVSLLFAASATLAGELELRAGPARTSLLELYTSEGCSSCPPADRWMSSLVDDKRIWDKVVPVAFHVDYWDYIGWKDRFARKEFSHRQRAYAYHGGVQSVYTPGFVVGGEEWRSWFWRPNLNLPQAPDPGVLRVKRSGKQLEVNFDPTPAGRGKAPKVHVAILGFDLTTAIRAGENRGRELRHDFVVIGYGKSRLREDSGKLHAAVDLPRTRVAAPRTALAVWISYEDHPRPIQAVGGWM